MTDNRNTPPADDGESDDWQADARLLAEMIRNGGIVTKMEFSAHAGNRISYLVEIVMPPGWADDV